MGKLKIATHNSVTGEKSHWLSWLLIPFARCQSKTIVEQYDAGCRMFDFRAKFAFGKWRGAHGLWLTNDAIDRHLHILNILAKPNDPIHVSLTFEGSIDSANGFIEKVKEWKRRYPYLTWGLIAAKYSKRWTFKVEYAVIEQGDEGAEGGTQAFLPLDGRHWQTFLPIPWLWKQFYFRKVEFNDKQFKYVDFL